MVDYLFTEFQREHRPLARLLHQWADLARSRASSLRRSDFVGRDDAQLVTDVLEDWQRQAKPLARQAQPITYQEPGVIHRKSDDGQHITHWRWLFKFPTDGNLELVETWPSNLRVEPSGNNLYDAPAPEVVWQLAPGGPVAILDVPMELDPEGEISPTDRVLNATKLLDLIIASVNDELSSYERELRKELRTTIAKRRQRLGNIEANLQVTVDLVARERPPLQVDVIPSTAAEGTGETVAHAKVDLPVATSRKTFDDLVEVTQRWINASQRYPFTFNKMAEEEITSVLVTALNLAFDTAQREVFVGNGKSDIYVEAELGNRDRAAFVGESKMWGGPRAIEKHIRQLLGYAPSHIREVAFLYYARVNDIDAVRKNTEAAISGFDDLFERWINPGTRVVMKHPKFGHEIEVALLFAHFPNRV